LNELRVGGEGTVVRIFYYLRKADAIIVFHAFQKKSQKTPVSRDPPGATKIAGGVA